MQHQLIFLFGCLAYLIIGLFVSTKWYSGIKDTLKFDEGLSYYDRNYQRSLIDTYIMLITMFWPFYLIKKKVRK